MVRKADMWEQGLTEGSDKRKLLSDSVASLKLGDIQRSYTFAIFPKPQDIRIMWVGTAAFGK
jgi:hypothetical protein